MNLEERTAEAAMVGLDVCIAPERCRRALYGKSSMMRDNIPERRTTLHVLLPLQMLTYLASLKAVVPDIYQCHGKKRSVLRKISHRVSVRNWAIARSKSKERESFIRHLRDLQQLGGG